MHFLLSRLRCAARALIRSRSLEASVAPDLARAALALLLGLSGMSTQAQTCGMPGRDGTAASSGVVNTYYTPANGSYGPSIQSIGLGASQDATTPVAPGDLVAVLQMQCANINSTNTSN